jgi:hypothetical protein
MLDGADFRPSFPMLPPACVVMHETKLPKLLVDDGDLRPWGEVKLELRACISLCIMPVGHDFQPRATLQVTLIPRRFQQPKSGQLRSGTGVERNL